MLRERHQCSVEKADVATKFITAAHQRREVRKPDLAGKYPRAGRLVIQALLQQAMIL